MSGAAGRDIDPESPVGIGGQETAAPHVIRNRADLDAGGDKQLARQFRGVENRVDDLIVAEVGPAMVHVEDSDVEAVAIGRRDRISDARVLEEIVSVVDIAFLHCVGHDASGMPCSVSWMM